MIRSTAELIEMLAPLVTADTLLDIESFLDSFGQEGYDEGYSDGYSEGYDIGCCVDSNY